MPEYSFDEIIEMWNNDDEIKKFRMERMKDEYKWALEHNEKLVTAEKISVKNLKSESYCGDNTVYAERGLVFFYNSQDELLAWKIIFDKRNSVFNIVYKHEETADTSNGWYDELNYAKFISIPFADPMDLIMLSNGFAMIYSPKYGKKVDLSR